MHFLGQVQQGNCCHLFPVKWLTRLELFWLHFSSMLGRETGLLCRETS